MDTLSPLLSIAIVVLVLVMGLAWWQRRATVDASARSPRSEPRATPPLSDAVDVGAPDARPPAVHDQVLGRLLYGDTLWEGEDEIAFANTTVCIEIAGGPEGPTDRAREIVRTALGRQADLDARARAMLAAALPDIGHAGASLTPFSIATREDEQHQVVGVIWYEIGDLDGEIGVASADSWQTLTIERMY